MERPSSSSGYRRSSPPRRRNISPSSERPVEKTLNVLERMYNTYAHRGPLSLLYKGMTSGTRMKVWTSDGKIRGILTGIMVAFDKHWNLYMEDVEEVWLKKKKCKTPYLLDIDEERTRSIPDMKPKVPRVKKKKPQEEKEVHEKDKEVAEKDKEVAEKGKEAPAPTEPELEETDAESKKKKKSKFKMMQRQVPNLFIRGSSVVKVGMQLD